MMSDMERYAAWEGTSLIVLRDTAPEEMITLMLVLVEQYLGVAAEGYPRWNLPTPPWLEPRLTAVRQALAARATAPGLPGL